MIDVKEKKRGKTKLRKLLEKIPEDELCGDITPEELLKLFNSLNEDEADLVLAQRKIASRKKYN